MPDKKNTNIISNIKLVPLGAPLNSFQINTPQRAATSVAPCPKPYEIAGPAFPAAIRFSEFPIAHHLWAFSLKWN